METEEILRYFAKEWNKIIETCSFVEVIEKRHSRLIRWAKKKMENNQCVKKATGSQ